PEIAAEAVEENSLRRRDDPQPRGPGQLRVIRQPEMLDAVRESERMLAQTLVDPEHLLDRHVADCMGGNPPSSGMRLGTQSAEFLGVEPQDAPDRRMFVVGAQRRGGATQTAVGQTLD